MSCRQLSARIAVRICGLALVTPLLCQPVSAQTIEQLRASCRESLKPQMKSCMQSKKGTGDRERNREACRGAMKASMQSCVKRAIERVASKKAAPAAPGSEDAGAAAEAVLDPSALVAPPRTIADITAILDSERPDPEKIAKLKADADAPEPTKGSPSELGHFYYDRGNARALLARTEDAIADGLKALEITEHKVPYGQIARIRQFLAGQYSAAGDPKKAIAEYETIIREGDRPGSRGTVINASRNLAEALVSMGKISEADAHMRRVARMVQEARGSPHPNWRRSYAIYGSSWESDADLMRARIFRSRGQYREAEAAYQRAEAFRRETLKKLPEFENPSPPEQVMFSADGALLAAAHMKSNQGRHTEAEADARRALLSVLKHQGKYNPRTPRFIIGLANILVEQGRHREAEQLMRSALEINDSLGIREDAPATAALLSNLGNVLIAQRKNLEAVAVYTQLEQAIAKWEPSRRDVYLLTGPRITALYAAGQTEAGIAAAQELVRRQVARVGENHFDTAFARGTLAMGYANARRDGEAVREFKAAIPLMIEASRQNTDDDETSLVAVRSQRLQTIVETYIRVLARAPDRSNEIAVETFALADAIRGHSVQRALVASSARMAVKDPAMAELVRMEQDLGKQLSAQVGTLNNVLSLPSGERDDGMVRAINAAIEKLRADRRKTQQEIARRFPAYAELIDPKPPTVEQIKSTLRADEALLSFYFGRSASFVWAVPKEGSVLFAIVPLSAVELEARVRKLREALEPQATMLSEIPAFDIELGYELYSALLKPVEEGWKSARNLVVVTNGALGLLPLSLLPTEPVQVAQNDTPFSGYRTVPWLARTHAVTLVPSASALRTLRGLPPGKAQREQLIGFGDPFFSTEQADEADTRTEQPVQIAAAETTTRGLRLIRRSSPQLEGVDSADLAMLPRLPDTADELKSIAAALEADPSKVLYLGRAASEKQVKSIDLSGFKTIAFATHGLVPGDLDGLSQPALALSAPDVSDSDGDGLLTMEEILALKLDADWVVLSACNTGTGAGAGAEAASGLGRAFFYAGTRALLVTNWSVHSASARDLVTDLFRRQAADAKITRSEALRQAMLALIDGPGFTDKDGKTLFSYAHPLFWAPYSIIGDGGAN